MRKITALCLLLAFCFACSPSQNAVQTAIAQTQAAAPTATPAAPRPPPPPPPPPATPALFGNSARSLVPGQADMPNGFSLNPSNSGPVSMADGGDAYANSFMNMNNLLSPNGDAIIVALDAYVDTSLANAQGLMDRMKNDMPTQMASSAPGPVTKAFVAVTASVPHVEQTVAMCGTVQGPMLPMTVCSVASRVKNVVTWTLVGGTDSGSSQGAILNQAIYFTSLMADKTH
jgi:glucose/arabinose dehydrogenase